MAQTNTTPVPLGDFPIGTVLPFAGTVNASLFQTAGWLYCNGNTVSRTDYADLFAVIGTANGAGDGVSSFSLPDFRGTFLRGVNAGSTNDPDATSRTQAAIGGNTGDSVGSIQGYAIGTPVTAFSTNNPGNHTHTIAHIPTDSSSTAIAGSTQVIWNGSTDNAGNTDKAGAHSHTITGGGDNESRPVNVNAYYIIKFAQV